MISSYVAVPVPPGDAVPDGGAARPVPLLAGDRAGRAAAGGGHRLSRGGQGTLAITNGPDFLLIGRACRVCRIWFDRDQSEDSRVVPIVPDTAYTTAMTNRQTGSKDNNTDSPSVWDKCRQIV